MNLTSIEFFSVFFQQTNVYLTLILLFFFFVTAGITHLNTSSSKSSTLFSVVKVVNISILSVIFILTLIRFFLYLWSFKVYGFYSSSFDYFSLQLDMLPFSPVVDLNYSVLSDVIILLAFSSGLVCLYLLGEKSLVSKLPNISIFSGFLIGIIIMVYTANLLVMFIGFECLFLPTLYFIYHHGYVERVDKTLKILLYWTLFGAFLVFSTIAYIYVKYRVLNFHSLVGCDFTPLEKIIISLCIFLGFGVKVPVFPFHYWLTKIHVEAPAGFSIFLSGFLVKAAIYCFYYFNILLSLDLLTLIANVVSIVGVIEASIKMWTQTDFKKLIAFATIQEMNLILFLLLNYQNLLEYSLMLFILIHGWLSTLMFFLVDIIQKKTASRNIVSIGGIAYNFPELKLIVWFVILMFSGFPLTVKFLIEWQVFGSIMLQSKVFYLITFLVVVALGVVGFSKQLIIVLYGFPRHNINKNYTLSKRDKYLFYFIISILIALSFLNYFLG